MSVATSKKLSEKRGDARLRDLGRRRLALPHPCPKVLQPRHFLRLSETYAKHKVQKIHYQIISACLRYDCKDLTALENTAGPKGCLQYFLGDSTGAGILDNFGIAVSTSSPTYGTSTQHLQNQDYNICIRYSTTVVCQLKMSRGVGKGGALWKIYTHTNPERAV